MTSKRLRTIAMVIRKGLIAGSPSTLAISDELDQHATELEIDRKPVRLQEPVTLKIPHRTVFGDLAAQSGNATHESDDAEAEFLLP